MPVERKTIAELMRGVIEAIGEDPGREGLVDTPRRVADMYVELFSGLGSDPRDVLLVGFEENHEEMVIVKDIPFYSMCEHHLLPFFGVAHVAYIPKGRVVGISKLARAVEILSRRPQIQERLTGQIADAVNESLKPVGVAVVLQAEHFCMTMRGIKKPGSNVVTSANRGAFRTSPVTRSEFLALVGQQGHT